jgi:hypothetical protein
MTLELTAIISQNITRHLIVKAEIVFCEVGTKLLTSI